MPYFHLAPFRFYKVILAVAALVTPVIYFLCVPSLSLDENASRRFAFLIFRMSLPWIGGWFLILFGDGTWGRTFVSSMRSYCVILGVGLIFLPVAWAITWAEVAS